MERSALLTDLYQLTMAYGYWFHGIAQRRSIFHLFFRQAPFHGGYAVAAGLADVVKYVEEFKFQTSELDYLATLPGADGQPIFSAGFLEFLSQLKLSVDIDAVAEGTVVFPHEPLIRVSGSLLECQLLETALLNTVNFQTLIATKAARITRVAGAAPVLEFGLRRAQGGDGAITASRAAFIGGCSATSNVLAGMRLGIPVKGTHAHSWVMAFDDERSAFRAYAEAMPNNCVFLVDTYDTLEGVKHAIKVAQSLRSEGHQLVGIRLDSGDLCELSQQARKLLDAAGLQSAAVVASNDLDEYLMESLHSQGAKIDVWGVGTKLVTAYDQPALGGVYKLGAMESDDGQMIAKLKVSEQLIKISNPGSLQVRRYLSDNKSLARGDVIVNELQPVSTDVESVDALDPTHTRVYQREDQFIELLQPAIRSGQSVASALPLSALQAHCRQQLAMFSSNALRLTNPDTYPVGLERQLYNHKIELVTRARQAARSDR